MQERIELLKASIRPSLAIWAAVMFSLTFILDRPMGTPLTWICAGCLLEWIGERGIKRAREMFGGK